MTATGGSLHTPRAAPLSVTARAMLVIEVIGAYGQVRRCTRRLRLPDAVAQLRDVAPATRQPALADPSTHGRRLGHVVTRILGMAPVRSTCLLRSLVLLRLLAARGVRADLVIAAQPSDTKPLDAHAWVELDGKPLLAPEPTFGRLLTL
jgi:hypothetical protein